MNCIRLIADAFRRLAAFRAINQPPRPAVDAAGITSVVGTCAAGGMVVVKGSGFGAVQPSRVSLVIPAKDGCQEVSVAAKDWKDHEIRFALPTWAVGGCVGFRDANLVKAWRDYTSRLNQFIEQINATLMLCGRPPLPKAVYAVPCPPCTGTNELRVGPPVILQFSAAAASPVVIEPNGTVKLTWQVENAGFVALTRVSGPGPAVAPGVGGSGGPGIVGSHTLSFAAAADGDAVYRLSARNACGTTIKDFTIFVRRTTAVRVVGLEVNQALQNFGTTPGATNDVFLINNKRTIVRAVVDSGFPSSYNSGGRLQVRATLTMRGLDGQFPLATMTPIGATTPVVTIGNIGSFARAAFGTTVNFELSPLPSVRGRVRLTLTLTPAAPNSRWSSVTGSVDVTFRAGGSLTIVPVLVNNTFSRPPTFPSGAGLPTGAAIGTAMTEMRAMLPLANAALAMNVPTSTGTPPVMPFDRDMDIDGITDSSWDDLLDELENLAEGFADNGETWCAIVANGAITGAAQAAGMAVFGGPWWHPKASWTEGLVATPTHEIGHTLGFLHNQGARFDGGVAGTRLGGLNVATQTVIPPGTGELMSQAASSPTGGFRWPSLETYTEMDDELR